MAQKDRCYSPVMQYGAAFGWLPSQAFVSLPWLRPT
jgi:hypothetical protein